MDFQCTWPMEFKELEYIPRKIGESWSCYWHNYKPKRSADKESHSEWLSFFTPPYTPKTEVSPAASSDTSTHSSNGFNRLDNTYSKESVDLCSSKDVTILNSPTKQKNSINDLLPTHNDSELMDVSNVANLNQFSLSRLETSSLESIKLQTETNVNSQRNFDSIKSTTSPKYFETGVPVIINIETGKLVSMESIINNRQLPQNELVSKTKSQKDSKRIISNTAVIKQVSSKNFVQNSSPLIPGLSTKSENLVSKNYIKVDDKTSVSSSVEVRTVNIEGLPPVTLRYEVPTILQESNSPKMKNCKENSEPELAVSKKIEEKCTPPLSKKSLMASKMYQKFSFSELRKAKSCQKNSLDKVQVSYKGKNDSEIKKPVHIIKEVNPVSGTKTSDSVLEANCKISSINQILPDIVKSKNDISHNSEIFELTNSTKVDRNMSTDSDNSKDNVISDLDSFLNDFIEENKVHLNENVSVLPNVDDDWLSSLLT